MRVKDGVVLALGEGGGVFLRSAVGLMRVKVPEPWLAQLLAFWGGRLDAHVELAEDEDLRARLQHLRVLAPDEPHRRPALDAGREVATRLSPLGQLTVVDDFGSPATEQLVSRARAERRPIVLARLRGRPVVGPVFGGSGAVCPRCFFATVRANDVDTALAIESSGADVRMDLPLSDDAVGRFVDFVYRVTDADLDTVRSSAAVLVNRDEDRVVFLGGWPSCSECAEVSSAISCDAEFGRVRSVVTASVAGSVHVARVEFALGHRPRDNHGVAAVRYWQAAVAEGKGQTPDDATAAALGEVVERASGCFDPSTPLKWSRYHDVSDRAVHPAALLHWSPAQYAARVAGAINSSPHNRVPERWDPAEVIPWVEAEQIGTGAPRLLPAAYAYTNVYAMLGLTSGDPFLATSNGCAAATTKEQALERGLLELVERDAVAIWWYNRLPRPELVDADGDPAVEATRAAFADAGRELWLLDLTHDLGVPTAAAVAPIVGGKSGPSRVVLGFGSGWRPVDAARSAVLEAAQFLPQLARFEADDARLEPDTARWWRELRIFEEPWLLPMPSAPRAASVCGGVDHLLARLTSLGLDVLSLDQSRPWFDLTVVRVVVPGLRHFWRRLAAGRLYDVPVELGWRTGPIPERQTNRFDVFF